MTLPRTMLSQGVMKNWTLHEIIQNKKASSGKIGKTLFKWIDQLCLWISVLIICLSTQITTTWWPLVDHWVTTRLLLDHYYRHWKYPRCYMHPTRSESESFWSVWVLLKRPLKMWLIKLHLVSLVGFTWIPPLYILCRSWKMGAMWSTLTNCFSTDFHRKFMNLHCIGQSCWSVIFQDVKISSMFRSEACGDGSGGEE